MALLFAPIFPGMLFDAAARFAQNQGAVPAGTPIRDFGWASTLVPEKFGGVGGNLSDLASITEALATHGVQLPVIEACAIAPILLQAVPSDIAQTCLAKLCGTDASFLPLTALSSPLKLCTVVARQLPTGYELTGRIQGVDYSSHATHHLIVARTEGTPDASIFVVEQARIPVPSAVFRTMEGRKAADFDLASLALPGDACIAKGEAAAAALNRADNAALLLTAVDTVACLAAVISHTVTHLQERRQFGVALSGFQVLRHRTADMYVRYLAACGLLTHAYGEYERSAADLSRTLTLMKISLAESARACAEAAIQMHGGMGMSEEVLATRLAQRLLASEFRYGDRLLHTTALVANPG